MNEWYEYRRVEWSPDWVGIGLLICAAALIAAGVWLITTGVILVGCMVILTAVINGYMIGRELLDDWR